MYKDDKYQSCYFSLVAIFVLSNILTLNMFAQKPEVLCDKLIINTVFVSSPENSLYEKNEPIFVFSTIANNPVFSDSITGLIINSVNFLDALVVVIESDTRIKVKSIYSIYSPNDSLCNIPIGWVDKNNVLLSKHCNISKSTNLNEMAWVINPSINSILTKLKDSLTTKNNCPKPVFKNTYPFQKFYIYHEMKDYYLLGIAPEFDLSTTETIPENMPINKIIKGWVPKTHAINWSHNLSWELNWQLDAAYERKWIDDNQELKGCFVFNSKKSVEDQDLSHSTIIENNNLYNYRKEGLVHRFPIISDDSNDSLKCCSCLKKIGIFQDTLVCFITGEGDTIKKEVIKYQEKYALFKGFGQELPSFQPVLMINNDELSLLHYNLSKLITVKHSLQRDVKKAMIEVLKCFVGYYDNSFENVKIGMLLNKLSCFKIKKQYRDWSINDIEVSREDLKDDIEELRKDLIETSKIIKIIIDLGDNFPSKYKYTDIDGTPVTLYWIPMDIFPHEPKKDDVSNSYY